MFESYFKKKIKDPSNPRTRKEYGYKSSLIGLMANGFLSFSKIALGSITGAISITADGFNNLTDMLSSLVSLLGFSLASKPADREHPYGHARIEYIASSIVGLIILWAGVSLLWESIQTLLHPKPITVNLLSFFVLLLSIAVKILLYKYNYTLGTLIHSELVIATGLDAKNDVLATAGVVLSMIFLKFFGINIDAMIGILVSLIILKSGIDTLKSTIDSILGEGPSIEKVKELTQFIKSYPGVLGIHDLMVHDYGPGKHFLTVHVEVDARGNIIELHELIDRIERELEDEYNLNATIHMDPLVIHDPKTQEIWGYIKKKLEEIDPDLDFHDFRLVETYKGLNLIFDVLIPIKYKMSEKELKKVLEEKIHKEHPEYRLVVTFDLDYHNELGLEED